MRKYLFTIQDHRVPVGYFTESGRLAALIRARTEVKNTHVMTLKGREQGVASRLVLSLIESMPEVVPGLPNGG